MAKQRRVLFNVTNSGFPYMPFPVFTSPAVWCCVFQSRVFSPPRCRLTSLLFLLFADRCFTAAVVAGHGWAASCVARRRIKGSAGCAQKLWHVEFVVDAANERSATDREPPPDSSRSSTRTHAHLGPDRTGPDHQRGSQITHTYIQTDRQTMCDGTSRLYICTSLFYTKKKLFTAVGYCLLITAGREVHKSIEITENN